MKNNYKVTTTKNFDVCINVLGTYGYFEHHVLGEECGGGLWFEDGELVDYDGVYNLPLEVVIELENRGVLIDGIFSPNRVAEKRNIR